jgi:hypothetical protein
LTPRSHIVWLSTLTDSQREIVSFGKLTQWRREAAIRLANERTADNSPHHRKSGPSGPSNKGDVTALPKYPVFQLNLKP